MQEYQALNLVEITRAGLKYRKHILLLTLIGIIVGLIIAFTLTPRYEASAIFYPTANSSISKSVLDNSNLEGLLEIGSEEQTDHMLQLLSSDEIATSVINRFNLMAHYEIDKNEKYAFTKVRKRLAKNVDYKRTDYLAVKISVTDENPQYAADIANYIGSVLDSVKLNLQRERTQQAFGIIEEQYHSKRKQLDSLQLSLTDIRMKGVYDYEAQSEVLAKAIIQAEMRLQEEEARLRVYRQNRERLPDSTIVRAEGRFEAAKAALKILQPRVQTFGVYSGKYLENEALIKSLNEDLARLKIKYDNAKVDFAQRINQKFVIDQAEKPEIRSFPNRFLIVVIFSILGFMLGLFMAVYNEIIHPQFKLR